MAAKLAALYYPHMSIRSEGFLKNAMLLWDEVSFICPQAVLPRHLEGDAQKALDQIAKPLNPSRDEKRQVHDAVVELVNSDLPKWFLQTRGELKNYYYIDPQKFFSETWEELYRKNLIRETTIYSSDPPLPGTARVKETPARQRRAYQTTRTFGHLLMSMIAEVCAGQARQLVTEEIVSYTALDKYMKLIGGADLDKRPTKEYDRLVTLSLQTLNLSQVDIAALARVRASEDKKPELRKMRHSYVSKLEGYVTRLSTEAKGARDVEEIERQFKQEVKDDVGLLREELKDGAKKFFFSKEFGAAVVAIPGTALLTPFAAFGAVPLVRPYSDFKVARNKTLAGHSMSWLYVAPRRFRLF